MMRRRISDCRFRGLGRGRGGGDAKSPSACLCGLFGGEGLTANIIVVVPFSVIVVIVVFGVSILIHTGPTLYNPGLRA